MNIQDILIEKVEILFVLIVFGFIVKKAGYFKKEFTVELGNLLLRIVTPLTIFNSFMADLSSERSSNLFLTIIIYSIVEVVSILIAVLFFHDRKYGIECFATVLGNVGFFGLPLILSVLGEESVLYGAAVVAINGSLMWSFGIYVLTRDKNSISFKSIITTPSVVATIFGVIFYFTNIRIPAIVQSSISSLSSVSGPLCALIIGSTLAETEFAELKDDVSNVICVIVRLIVIPFVVLLLFKFIDNKFSIVKYSILILSCTPSASTTPVFAYKYNYDADKAARLTCACSLLCVLTIPFMTKLAGLIW